MHSVSPYLPQFQNPVLATPSSTYMKPKNLCFPSCLDVTDEHGEYEDPHEPGRRHEDDLRDVVLRRLRVLPNRDGRLRGEIEAPKTMFKKMLQRNTKVKKDGKQYLFMKCA
jgi:hypothetical protein